MRKGVIGIIGVFVIAVIFWILYYNFVTPRYLTFSDGAKFADVARNFYQGLGYGSKFAFFSPPPFDFNQSGLFSARGILVGMPLMISLAYRLFGIGDFAVIATSGVFYVALVVAVYLLGKRIFGSLVGFLSAIAIAVNVNFLEYATNGASEILFSFLIVFSFYFLTRKDRFGNVFAILLFIALYLTRPQGFIYILGGILFWLLRNYQLRKVTLYFSAAIVVGIIVNNLLLSLNTNSPLIYSILGIALFSATQHTPGEAVSSTLRRSAVIKASYLEIFKKVFYNLYNFYRLLPDIASPYIWGLFAIGLFRWSKDRLKNAFRLTVLALLAAIFLSTAITIPFFRYLHPVVPLVYISSVATLVWIVEKISDSQSEFIKRYLPGVLKNKSNFVAIVATTLILLFVVGQTMGVIFLDSRFKAKLINRGKPPVYAVLAEKLNENTDKDDIVVTNLDTWGSWYGERRTVWFPIEPNQLIYREGKEINFDAIYLTDYLIDDENYYMGEEWRSIFRNPKETENEYIRDNFELKEIFELSEDETFEKHPARAILLVRKAV